MARLPNNSQRLVNVGRTGSGKTQAGVWHLSKRNIDRFPWIVFNWKEDDLINGIDRAEHIDLGEVPKHPGIYIVSPHPSQTEEVDALMWKIWEREGCGVFVDEALMIGNASEGFDACLTQGRSKRIPMIINTQRPVWVSRFVWSESDFIQVFDITTRDDRKTVESYVPVNLEQSLPKYHSWYYDVPEKDLTIFKPVPSQESILETIDAKLKKQTRKI